MTHAGGYRAKHTDAQTGMRPSGRPRTPLAPPNSDRNAPTDTGLASQAADGVITGRSARACPITMLNSQAHKIGDLF
jgi:hypothetical protein